MSQVEGLICLMAVFVVLTRLDGCHNRSRRHLLDSLGLGIDSVYNEKLSGYVYYHQR